MKLTYFILRILPDTGLIEYRAYILKIVLRGGYNSDIITVTLVK